MQERAPGPATALVVLVASACSSTEPPVEFPESVTHLASVALSDGQLIAASALRPVEAQLPLAFSKADQPWALGYDLSELEVTPDNEPLRLATGCEPSLPEPVWASEWQGDRFSIIESAVPRLTGAFLDGVCPARSPEDLALDLDCDSRSCPQLVNPRSRCQFTITLEVCRTAVFALTVQPDGSLCVVEDGASESCTPTVAVPGAAASFQCAEPTACEVHAYDNLSRVEPPFSVERVSFVDIGETFQPDALAQRWIRPKRVEAGYASDMIALDDGQAIVVGADEPSAACLNMEDEPRRLWRYDALTLELVGTSTTVACLTRLAVRSGGGFFGAYFDQGDVWRLGTFSSAGALERSVVIDPSGAIDGPFFRVNNLFVLEAPLRVFVAIGNDEGDLNTGTIYGFDPGTLETRGQEVLPFRSYEATDLGSVGVVLTTANARAVYRLDPEEPRIVDSWTLPPKEVTRSLLGMTRDPDDPTRLLMSSQVAIETFDVDSSSIVEELTTPRYDIDLIDVAAWPANGLTLWGGITPSTGQAREAVVTLFDARGRRFLPGVFKIGEGVLGRMRTAPDGSVLVLLPGAAELVRLVPTSR